MDLLIVACSPQGGQPLKLDEEVRELQKVRPISPEVERARLAIITTTAYTLQAMPISRLETATSPDVVRGLLKDVNTKRFLFSGHGDVRPTSPQPMQGLCGSLCFDRPLSSKF